MQSQKRILLTGVTGYIGGRLINGLLNRNYSVRCLVRNPEFVSQKYVREVEIRKADLRFSSDWDDAFEGVDTAYYLIHSMGLGEEFVSADRAAALNFANASKKANIRRIVYLGGLGDSKSELSPHLKSRHEVGDILRSSGVQVIELRASIILGSGSLSFELVRALVERLPVMITPRWVGVKAQPISIQDVLQYLLQSIDIPTNESNIFEIGGADIVSYGEIMNAYAAKRGLKRYMISVPVLTPRLSSLWLGLVTPVYARIGRALIESVKHPTVVNDFSAKEYFNVKPQGLNEAISTAISREDQEFGNSYWSDAVSSALRKPTWGGTRIGSRLIDSRSVTIKATKEQAFRPIRLIGGANGWYFANFLWKIRGAIDILFGGVGLRRGRRSQTTLAQGEALDFWRVEKYVSNSLLRLSAEMKVPGRAWLQFEVEQKGDFTEIRQIAEFDSVGLSGLLYWYGIYPLHALVFGGMLKAIAKKALEMKE